MGGIAKYSNVLAVVLVGLYLCVIASFFVTSLSPTYTKLYHNLIVWADIKWINSPRNHAR